MLNKVILIGNLGHDPEARYSQNGTCVCNFNLATTEKYKDEEKTEWHRIVAFGKVGEICGEYLHKGSKIYLEGKIQTRQWEDRDGNKKYTTEIIARVVKFLSKSENYEESTGEYDHPSPDDKSVPF